MATTPTIPNQSTGPISQAKPEILDWSKATDKVTEVTDYLRQFEGKPGHNCFIYYNKFIQPLVTEYQKGTRTKELYDKMFSLVKEPPTVDKLPNEISNIITGLPPAKLWEEKPKQ